jgi:hypothetical protein
LEGPSSPRDTSVCHDGASWRDPFHFLQYMLVK